MLQQSAFLPQPIKESNIITSIKEINIYDINPFGLHYTFLFIKNQYQFTV